MEKSLPIITLQIGHLGETIKASLVDNTEELNDHIDTSIKEILKNLDTLVLKECKDQLNIVVKDIIKEAFMYSSDKKFIRERVMEGLKEVMEWENKIKGE